MADIIRGNCPSPQTIKKLATAFSGNGLHERPALEDYLLMLAGYRTPRPREELGSPRARLMEIIAEFNGSQLGLMEHFAQFLSEIKDKTH